MADAYRALYDHISANGKRGHSRRIGCIVPSGNRGSTYIRVGLPLAHEEMQRRVLAVRPPARLTTASEFGAWIDRLGLQTILFSAKLLIRRRQVSVVEMCRAKGVRVVFEIDDNLLELDQSHADYESGQIET